MALGPPTQGPDQRGAQQQWPPAADNGCMNTLVLEGIAFVAVVLSLGLAALVVTISLRSHVVLPREDPVVAPATDSESVAETMSRVLGEIERLAELRDRGVLTAKEFTAQKAKLLENQP